MDLPTPAIKGDARAVQLCDFSTALNAIKSGRPMRRIGWNGKGMWIKLQSPEPLSKMTLPYIYMRTAQGNLVPWLASQTDLLSTDWCDAED